MSREQYRRELRWMYQWATGMPLRTTPYSKLEWAAVGVWLLIMLSIIGFMSYMACESFYVEYLL